MPKLSKKGVLLGGITVGNTGKGKCGPHFFWGGARGHSGTHLEKGVAKVSKKGLIPTSLVQGFTNNRGKKVMNPKEWGKKKEKTG